jgi:hypothetical protein
MVHIMKEIVHDTTAAHKPLTHQSIDAVNPTTAVVMNIRPTIWQ